MMVHAFLDRPLAGEWPYLWLDATYLKQHEGGHIGSADHCLLLRRALADQIADHDKPDGDADGEPLRSAGLQQRHCRF